jgi:hypothetical protein
VITKDLACCGDTCKGRVEAPNRELLPTHHLELSQQQLEALASGRVLSFEHTGVILRVTADAEAVAAFKQHVYQALLAHVNQSNQSIQ